MTLALPHISWLRRFHHEQRARVVSIGGTSRKGLIRVQRSYNTARDVGVSVILLCYVRATTHDKVGLQIRVWGGRNRVGSKLDV